eukprot:25014-Prymnesium_polylepis.1
MHGPAAMVLARAHRAKAQRLDAHGRPQSSVADWCVTRRSKRHGSAAEGEALGCKQRLKKRRTFSF